MNSIKLAITTVFLILLSACAVTTGEIKQNKFYVENDFSVDLMDDDWQVVRQKRWMQYGERYEKPACEISFVHKKSNGAIGINSMSLDEVDQARSLEVHAENEVARRNGIKLSQKMTKIDGIDAIELVISGNYMTKYIFFKKGQKGYELIYINTPAYFDEYLGVFDRFIKTLKIL